MMTVHGTIVVSMVFFCLTVAAVPAAAEWVENGRPVCTESGDQIYQDAVRLENGLVVMVWEDSRYLGVSIFAQCVDPFGNTLWAVDGVLVCTDTLSSKAGPKVVTDGVGGVIVAWSDGRSDTGDIYAQRLDGDGNMLWATGGVPVCTAIDVQVAQVLVSDGYSGAIIAWLDARYGLADTDIYAQRVDEAGAVQWTANGIFVCVETGRQEIPSIVTNGDHGAIVTWQDNRGVTGFDIYAQKVGNNGVLHWPVTGALVSGATLDQSAPKMVPDGYGGAIIAWQDSRSAADYDIYAQRMGNSGTALWTTNGEAICAVSGTQYIDDIVTDGNGGAIVIWSDARTGDFDVYVQRVNRNGLEQWDAGGTLAIGGTGEQLASGAVSDGSEGVIIASYGNQNGDSDIYVQRVGQLGGVYFVPSGTPVCDFPGEQSVCVLVEDGMGGAVVVWQDYRNTVQADLYTQRIGSVGYWGYPCPFIFEGVDVPNDQGGRLMLTWEASRLDRLDEAGIEYYSIWRKLGMPEMQALLDAGTKEISPDMIGPDFDGDAFRFISLEGEMYGFEWIANQEAHRHGIYSFAAPTLYDSTAADPGLHTFMVSAHVFPTLFWDSPPFVGFSVDNLSPCVPLALAGEQMFTPAGMDLTWDPNIEADLGGYNIYRDIGSSYQPGPGNLIETTCDENMFDGDWGWNVGFCYKVSAVDVNGNESDFAVLCSGEVTGDDPMPVPDKTFLAQNFPNPFNPITTIGFGIKESGYISIRIYDAAGRLVTTLVDESRPAGSYAAEWNGKSADGSSVSSGVYFYRLITKEFKETKKMILLR